MRTDTTTTILREALTEYGFDPSTPPPQRREWRPGRAQWFAIFRAARVWARSEAEATDLRILRFPPFPPPEGVPAHALVFACRVLRDSTHSGSESWRQGWDSAGHWGLNAQALEDCWIEARRHVGARFSALLRWRLRHPGTCIPRVRSLSGPAALRVLRAPTLSWTSAPEREDRRSVSVSMKCRKALGHLDPVVQAVALQGAAQRALDEHAARTADLVAACPVGRWTQPTVRVRHCDWTAAREAQSRIARTPGERRELVRASTALVAGREKAADRIVAPGTPLCEAYPAAKRELQARIALGESPSSVVPGLSRSEAHEYLSVELEKGYDVVGWLLRDTSWRTDWSLRHVVCRDVAVARWLVAIDSDPARREALMRQREIRVPGAVETRTVRYADRVDEIQAEDLVKGPRTSVDAAFRSAAKRLEEVARKYGCESHDVLRAPPSWWRPMPCAKPLVSAAQLWAEGKALDHCVGGYADAVKTGRCVIVALRVPEINRVTGTVEYHRSTVEFDAQGRVLQHRGPSNGTPHPICEKALEVLCRRCGIGGAR